jgi:DNA-binding winged helix-turn-helix (wHTH) protein
LWSFLAEPGPIAERAEVALSRGWLGLLPLLFAPAPGRWVLVLGDSIVCADRGTVSARAQLPGHARELLDALRSGAREKEDLVREVWGVAKYAPQLHDAVVHTAIARLRRAMGEAGAWIETTPQGYALRADVGVVELSSRTPAREIATRATEAPRPPEPAASLDALRSALAERPLRSSEIAERLGTSEATALRRLREAVASGEIARDGVGKRTRYRLARTDRPAQLGGTRRGIT